MIRTRARSAVPPTTPDVRHGDVIANGQLQAIVERIEKLEADRNATSADIREMYTEAKGQGYNVKALRGIVRERRQDAVERAEMEATMDAYRAELGMAVQLVERGLSLREAARATGVSKSAIHRAVAVPDVSHETDSGTPAAPQAGAEDGLAIPADLDRRQPSP
jgi:uncharacterized protein (UPF0335 family)